MALTLPEGHIPWKRPVTLAWNWTSLLCGTSEWLWEMEGPCRSAESHSEPQSLTPKRFHGQKGVSCMKKLRVRRDSELPGSFAHHCSHRAGLGLDLHLCPAVPQHGQALFTHISLHLYRDLGHSSAIQAQGRATAWEPQLKPLQFTGLLATFGYFLRCCCILSEVLEAVEEMWPADGALLVKCSTSLHWAGR